MMKKRLVMGAMALATVLGMAAGPLASSAGAGNTRTRDVSASPNAATFSDTVDCGGCITIFSGHHTGNGNLYIDFKDQGLPGDRFRATYVDATTGSRGIVGSCAVSSKTAFRRSLAVHIPSTRNFKVRVRICVGNNGVYPAGFYMRWTP
jgi:hypothetical protein